MLVFCLSKAVHPVHAGNTTLTSKSARSWSVHPRPRGEHRFLIEDTLIKGGSSPPTRGTPGVRWQHNASLRFIPAHAGNTRRSYSPPHPRPVHPRPRGEHLVRPPIVPGCQRFIPAHAGNTQLLVAANGQGAVHPRPRGEHEFQSFRYSSKAGSSPPTRGTQIASPREFNKVRFIPAHAGNTRISSIWM